jgi:hypothetical protein
VIFTLYSQDPIPFESLIRKNLAQDKIAGVNVKMTDEDVMKKTNRGKSVGPSCVCMWRQTNRHSNGVKTNVLST